MGSLADLFTSLGRHLLGDSALESVRSRNWTLVALIAPVLGFLSDCLQVLGPVSDFAFLLSAFLLAVALVIIRYQLPLCKKCAEWRVGLVIFTLIFGLVCMLQWLAGARNEGITAKLAPELSAKFVEVAQRFDRVEKKLDENEEQRKRDNEELGAKVGKTQITAEQIQALAASNSVTIEFLRSVLRGIDGQNEVKDSEVFKKIAEVIENYKKLRSDIESAPLLSPQMQEARRQALVLLDKGQIDDAKVLMADARKKLEAMREQHSKDEAQLLADEARIAAMTSDYETAAKKYEQAAKLREKDPEVQFDLLMQRAVMLSCRGYWHNDNAALQASSKAFSELVEVPPKSELRADALAAWASVLRELGNKKIELDTLEQALAVALRAESLRSRESDEAKWTRIQYEIGRSYSDLGNRRLDRQMIAKALPYLRSEAEYQRGRSEFDYGHALTWIGASLRTIATIDDDPAIFDEAIEASKAAIVAYASCKASCARDLWIAKAQTTLGWTYFFAARFQDKNLYRLAIGEFNNASLVQSPNNDFTKYIETVEGAAWSYLMLGWLEGDESMLGHAQGLFNRAMMLLPKGDNPLRWTSIVWGSGWALSLAGERISDVEISKFAVRMLEQAHGSLSTHGKLAGDLAIARFRLAKLEGNQDAVRASCKDIESSIAASNVGPREAYIKYLRSFLEDAACR